MSEGSDLVTVAPGLGAFLERHPWPQDQLALGAPLEFFWHFEVKATPAELWPFVSDTSRMNRAMGVTRMEFEEKDGVLNGRSSNAGFVQEWVEVPWSWVAERTITSTRIYSKGFAELVRAVFDLTPVGERVTRFHAYFGFIPRGFWQRWLLRIGVGPLERRFAEVLAEVERHVADNRVAPAPLALPNPELPPESLSRLEVLARRLVEQGVQQALVSRIVEHVRSADDMDLYRIQVVPLARRWEVDEDELLSACLRATRVGLLGMTWDVICPHCRGVRREVSTLGEVPKQSDCEACKIEFETDSESAVEITFHVHPSVRRVDRIFYCSAEPAFKSHIKLQQSVPPQSTAHVVTALGPGSYRLRVAGGPAASLLEVEEGGQSEELVWSADAAPTTSRLSVAPVLTLDNPSTEARTFVLEVPSWADDALRPSRLLSFQEFRDLFTKEYVGSDVQLSVGRQTILFTDVVGSTKLYVTRGDPGAFIEVKRHFTEIYEVVKQHHGAIVKTIGDAAMAAFSHPLDALRAAKEIHLRLPPNRPDLGIRVRASLNTGPCIAVNLNTGIDYFGNTVNVAAKLQCYAGAGQVAFPEAVLEHPSVREYLANEGVTLADDAYTTPGSTEALRIMRWDVNS